MLYEEKVAQNERDRKKLFISILAALVLSYLLSNAYAILNLPFAGIAEVVFIGILTVGVYLVYRHGLLAYIYRIEDDTLVFLSNNGKYDKVLCEVKISKVQYIARGKEAADGAMLFNVLKNSSGNCCTCVFKGTKGRKCKLWFEPSENYLAKVSELGIEVR